MEPASARRRRLGWAALLAQDTAIGYLAATPIYFIGSGVRRRLRLPARRHWPITAILLLLPLPIGYLWNTLVH